MTALSVLGSTSVTLGAPPVACDGVTKHPNKWSTITVPAFPQTDTPVLEPQQNVRGFAAAPDVEGLLFVHNGETILRSEDGGCTWETSFQLGLPPADMSYTALTTIVVGRTTGDVTPVYALGKNIAVGQTTVFGSDDGGLSWERRSTFQLSLPGYRVIEHPLVVAQSDPRVAYLSLTRGVAMGVVPTILRTTDGGKTWTELAPLQQRVAAYSPRPDAEEPFRVGNSASRERDAFNVAVDPLDEDIIWVWAGASGDYSNDTTFRSTDAGASFSKVALPPEVPTTVSLSDLSIEHHPGRPAQVVATVDDGHPLVITTSDEGNTWSPFERPPQDSLGGGGGEIRMGQRATSLAWFDWTNAALFKHDARLDRWIAIAPDYGLPQFPNHVGFGAGKKHQILYVAGTELRIEAYSGKL